VNTIKQIKSKPMLRFTTAGNVDDGKSTLIGRLLYDSKGIYDDHLESAKKLNSNGSPVELDLASITDGLQAEQEQGITIDVAYRYFSTPSRKFIIADTPGHEQYTRNMVTGASTADAAIILIDARIGVHSQSKRHAYLACLLGIKHLIIAINKMDLVHYKQVIFNDIRDEFTLYCQKLGVTNLHFLPVSALYGDMVTERGCNLRWYKGKTLLQSLETLDIEKNSKNHLLRFPVQLVNRPNSQAIRDHRSYMGSIASGVLRVGDDVIVLPSNHRTKIKDIITYSGSIDVAYTGQSVNVILENEIDISRGDMIVGLRHQPRVNKIIDAQLCWLSEQPLQLGKTYYLKHTTRTQKMYFKQLDYMIDISSLKQNKQAQSLQLNEVGKTKIQLMKSIVHDDYSRIRETGGFIVIDCATHNTVAAGMISHT